MPPMCGSAEKGSNGRETMESGQSCSTQQTSSHSEDTMTLWSDGRSPTLPGPPRADAAAHPPHQPTGTTDVLTFYPTMEEFRDFPGYIRKIEKAGGHSMCGVCKIVPPPEWHPRPSRRDDYSDIDNFTIKNPVKEEIKGSNGAYVKNNVVFRKSISVKDYRQIATDEAHINPHPNLKGADIEADYWRHIQHRKPIYGADTEGSIYDPDVKEFNMNSLGTILDEIKGEAKIHGVNTTYMYFGMYKTTFPWHAEDMDLYSINYLHFGEPKYWFGIAAESADRFEKLMRQKFDQFPKCNAFLRHKNYIVSTSILRTNGIPYGTMVQRPNEFMITFPRGYHMGFNMGYNCAESTNFASDRWIDFGKNAALCTCPKARERVEISMIPYMKKYRSDEYESWYDYWYVPQPESESGSPSSKMRKKDIKAGRGSKSPRKQLKRAHQIPEGVHSCEIASETLQSQPMSRPSTPITLRENLHSSLECQRLFDEPTIILQSEIACNMERAKVWPHCDICLYFRLHAKPETVEVLPTRSQRLVMNSFFAKCHVGTRTSLDQWPDPSSDILLTCSNCKVTVHPACYGGGDATKAGSSWKCLRCQSRSIQSIGFSACCLCEMRGGAVINCKLGKDTTHAHVGCAIMNRRTVFDREYGPTSCYTHPAKKHFPRDWPTAPLPIDYLEAMGDKHEKSVFQCEICGYVREGLIRCHECPENTVETVYAHASCARFAGYHFEQRHQPLNVVMICNRHRDNWAKVNGNTSPLSRIPCNVLVKGGQVGWVERGDLRIFAVVYFFDGSLSGDTPPIDIIGCSCRGCDGINHVPHSKLAVRWNDGKIYYGYFRCTTKAYEYTVHLQNGSTKKEIRNHILSQDDGDRLTAIQRKKLADFQTLHSNTVIVENPRHLVRTNLDHLPTNKS